MNHLGQSQHLYSSLEPYADGYVNVAAGAIVAANSSLRGCTVARNSTGVYTITTAQAVPVNTALCLVTIQDDIGTVVVSLIGVVQASTTTWTVTMVDVSYVVRDSSFSFSIKRAA